MMNRRVFSFLLCLFLVMSAFSGCCEMSVKDQNGESISAAEQAALVFTPSMMEQIYAIGLDMLTKEYDADTVEDIMEYYSIYPLLNEYGNPEEVQLGDLKYVGYSDAASQLKILFNTTGLDGEAGHFVIQSNYSVEEGVAVPLGAALYGLGLMSNDMQILGWITSAQNGDSYENEFYKIMYHGENGIDILVVFPQDGDDGNTSDSAAEQEPLPEETAVLHGVWMFDYAVNVDGDKCLPEECGGEWIFYLLNGGTGFLKSQDGYSGLKWSSQEENIILIELEQYVIPLTISETSISVSSCVQNGVGGQAQLFFRRMGDVDYNNSNQGTWFTSNIIEEDGNKFALARHFRDDGVTYPILWMYDAETDETAVAKGEFGYWLMVEDEILYCADDSNTVYKWHCSPKKACDIGRIDQSQGESVYEMTLGLLGLEYGDEITVYETMEEMSSAKLNIDVPINYDTPEWYAKRAGVYCGEKDIDGVHYVCKYILDTDGTAKYVLSDVLVEPQNIFEEGSFRWMPVEGGVNIWYQGNKEEPLFLTSINNGYRFNFMEEVMDLSPLPESYLVMMQKAEENNVGSLRDYLGVWTMIEQPEGEQERNIQIILNPLGTASTNTIVYMSDPRENYQEVDSELTWYPEKEGIALVTNDRDERANKHFIWKEGQLCSEDGFIFGRTADYSTWINGNYSYEAIKDYTQSGYAGVWKSEDMDMWEGEEYIYLYLASDGTGKYIEESGKWIREENSLIWSPEADGFKFSVPDSNSYHLFDTSKWFSVKAEAFAQWGKWNSPADGYLTFEHLEDFWVDASVSEGDEEAIIDYQVNDDGSITLTDYYLNTSELVIPETIDGYTQIRIGEQLFKGNTSFTKVTLPDTVVEIGAGAFQDCYNLQEVILGEGITDIGNDAFRDCSKLVGIAVPSGVGHIGDSAFANCSMLSRLEIAEGVVSIGAHAFEACSSLGDVALPDTIMEIGDYAFYMCGKNLNIDLPQNLTRLGEKAFAYCHGIVSVTIPASLQHIGEYAFEDCSGLSSVEFANGLIMLGKGMFAGCDSLTDINIPSSVKIVSDSAFSHCTKLAQVQLQEGVEVIADYAFNSCESLKNMLLPSTLHEIGTLALHGCYALTNLAIPERAEVFGTNVFGTNQFMLVLNVKEGSAAHKYALENGIEFEIGTGEKVQTVSYASSNDFSWELREDGTVVILQYKGKDQTVSVPAELDGCVVAEIGDKAFAENTDVSEVILSEGVLVIGAKSFYKCTELQKVVLPASLSEVKSFAFNNCPELILLVPGDSFAESYAASKKLKWENYTPETQEESNVVLPDVDDSEATLLQALNGLRHIRTYYEDFDGDGICEMFVETVSSGPDEYGLEGEYELWFISPFITKCINKYVSEYDKVSLVGDGVPYMIRYEEMYGGTDLYGVKNGEPVYVG